MNKILTSESVNINYPDKTCDIIADAVLDEALRQDPNAQMAVECAIKDDLLMIYGEATTTAQIDYIGVANEVLADIGYKKPFRVIQQISRQSSDINKAVIKDELCANDQGIVYGYHFRRVKRRKMKRIILHAAKHEDKIPVCGYARVTTDKDEQAESYHLQESYWSQKLATNPKHHFVGMFGDEAISGATQAKRRGFQDMIKFCRGG
jgi:hypothetical protein